MEPNPPTTEQSGSAKDGVSPPTSRHGVHRNNEHHSYIFRNRSEAGSWRDCVFHRRTFQTNCFSSQRASGARCASDIKLTVLDQIGCRSLSFVACLGVRSRGFSFCGPGERLGAPSDRYIVAYVIHTTWYVNNGFVGGQHNTAMAVDRPKHPSRESSALLPLPTMLQGSHALTHRLSSN